MKFKEAPMALLETPEVIRKDITSRYPAKVARRRSKQIIINEVVERGSS